MRLYDEAREEQAPVTMQDEAEEADKKRWSDLARTGTWGPQSQLGGKREVRVASLAAEEIQEADKEYDSDRPHAPTGVRRNMSRAGGLSWEEAEESWDMQRAAWKRGREIGAMSPVGRSDRNGATQVGQHDAVIDSTAPTVGELIDRLTIVNIKIYHLEDIVMESQDSETVCGAAKKTRALNRERSDLKNAITRLVQGEGARMDTKT